MKMKMKIGKKMKNSCGYGEKSLRLKEPKSIFFKDFRKTLEFEVLTC